MRIWLVCIALLPSIVILIYFYKRDKYKPEPKRLITLLFIISGLLVFPTAIIEQVMSKSSVNIYESFPWINNILHSYVISALIEESIKLFLIWLIAYRHRDFDEAVDGIIYAITVGLGFAAVENVFYCLNSGLTIAIVRAFTAVPLHCAASGLMGYFIGNAKFSKPNLRKRYFIIGLITAVIIHGTYNYLLFSIGYLEMYSVVGVVLLLLFSFLILGDAIKRLLADDVAHERHH